MKQEIPDHPWVEFGTDLILFDNRNCVIVVNYASKFFEILRLPNTEASTVISRKKSIPQFIFYEYKKFSQDWDFKHITSGPKYPKSNGLVEQNMQTFMEVQEKALRTAVDTQTIEGTHLRDALKNNW